MIQHIVNYYANELDNIRTMDAIRAEARSGSKLPKGPRSIRLRKKAKCKAAHKSRMRNRK